MNKLISKIRVIVLGHPWLSTLFVVLFAIYWGLRLYPDGYPSEYYMPDSIQGVIRDSQTGEPIEGVVAVLSFGVSGYKGLHGFQDKTLFIAESVSDEEGNYGFEPWGPVQNPGNLTPGGSAPIIRFFKTGYRKARLLNGGKIYTMIANRPPAKSEIRYTGKAKEILMGSFSTDEEEAREFSKNPRASNWMVNFYGYPCAWKALKNFFIAEDTRIRKIRPLLPQKDRKKIVRFLTRENILSLAKNDDDSCSDPLSEYAEYFKNVEIEIKPEIETKQIPNFKIVGQGSAGNN